MILWRFTTSDPAFSRQMAIKSLISGLVLFGLGMLILAAPQLVVIPLALIFFTIGFFLLMTAWRLFWSAGPSPSRRRGPARGEVQDAEIIDSE